MIEFRNFIGERHVVIKDLTPTVYEDAMCDIEIVYDERVKIEFNIVLSHPLNDSPVHPQVVERGA